MGTTRTANQKKYVMWSKINVQSACNLPYDEKKLIAEFILDMATTKKTAVELLKVFEDAERIIRRDGKIYSKAFFTDDLEFITPKEPKDNLTKEEQEVLAGK